MDSEDVGVNLPPAWQNRRHSKEFKRQAVEACRLDAYFNPSGDV